MLGRVLAQYHDLPLAQRIYTLVRLNSSPFAQLAKFVPPRGRLLDVGCGFGLWLNYLALLYPDLELNGIDIDPRKIQGARLSNNPRLTFELLDLQEIAPQSYDCVTIVDVLYLLENKRQQVQHAARALTPGGVLLLKDMDTRPRWKNDWNVFQELLAVRVVGLTAGERVEFLSAAQQAQLLREAGLEHIEIVPLDRGYLHPHVLVSGRAPRR